MKTIQTEIIRNLNKWFGARELVGPQVYKKYGEKVWDFFDYRLLSVLFWLRLEMGVPLVCNNWASGGSLTQRGFRSNLDQIVLDKTKKNQLYCSAHMRGQAVDLSSGKMTAKQIRQWIREHIDSCPFPIRLEDDKSAPTWVHIDICNNTDKPLVEFSD